MSAVVSDSSLITALGRGGYLDVLRRWAGAITVPRAVADEVEAGGGLPPWVDVVDVQQKHVARLLEDRLDRGEAEAIALAVETRSPALVIDERLGRQVAARLGVPVIGTAGVLLQAKGQGLIDAVRPALDVLDANGFRLSVALREGVLRRAGE